LTRTFTTDLEVVVVVGGSIWRSIKGITLVAIVPKRRMTKLDRALLGGEILVDRITCKLTMSNLRWHATNQRHAVVLELVRCLLLKTCRTVTLVVPNQVNATTWQACIGWAIRNVSANVDTIWSDFLLISFITFAMVIFSLLANRRVMIHTGTCSTLVSLAIINVEASTELCEASIRLTCCLLNLVIIGETVKRITWLAREFIPLRERSFPSLCSGFAEFQFGKLTTNNSLAFFHTCVL
jgi:hypothetical protein